MNRIVGFAVLAVGIALLIFGINESNSFGSDVSRFFTGNPTNRAMWFIIGGAASVITGLTLTFLGARRG